MQLASRAFIHQASPPVFTRRATPVFNQRVAPDSPGERRLRQYARRLPREPSDSRRSRIPAALPSPRQNRAVGYSFRRRPVLFPL